jgi:hypothetical protein
MTHPVPPMPDGREMLRHTVATLAYRASKAVRNAPPGFSTFQIAPGSRTPGQILAHLGDLMDWVLSQARGQQQWFDTEPGEWTADVDRLFRAIGALDAYLASDADVHFGAFKLFQGGIADALTHVGQINMLRRIAGAPVRGENYSRADISTGRVTLEQPAPRAEFD